MCDFFRFSTLNFSKHENGGGGYKNLKNFHCILDSGGAPRKGAQLSRQLVVTDQSDAVFFRLPGAKKKRTTVVHDLMASVKAVKGASKKH